MANFDFSLNSVPVSNGNSNYLKPYNIYNDVSIESTEIKSGTSQAGNNWKCLKINFVCDEGTYSESIFFPSKDEDFQRREFDMPNGGKRPTPSNKEMALAMVAAIGKAFNPDGFEKLREMSDKFTKFDDVANGLVAILNKAKNAKTSMKLVGRNNNGKVYAALPKPLGIMQDKETKEWRTFPIAIFGNKLEFSAYEEQQRSKYLNAKPTDMAVKDELNIDTPSQGSEDIDFSILD